MSTDVKQLSHVELTPEQIEWYLKHARQLRSEALVRGVRRLFAGLHRNERRLRTPVSGALCHGARKG